MDEGTIKIGLLINDEQQTHRPIPKNDGATDLEKVSIAPDFNVSVMVVSQNHPPENI